MQVMLPTTTDQFTFIFITLFNLLLLHATFGIPVVCSYLFASNYDTLYYTYWSRQYGSEGQFLWLALSKNDESANGSCRIQHVKTAREV
jgi:hypothetical protein